MVFFCSQAPMWQECMLHNPLMTLFTQFICMWKKTRFTGEKRSGDKKCKCMTLAWEHTWQYPDICWWLFHSSLHSMFQIFFLFITVHFFFMYEYSGFFECLSELQRHLHKARPVFVFLSLVSDFVVVVVCQLFPPCLLVCCS